MLIPLQYQKFSDLVMAMFKMTIVLMVVGFAVGLLSVVSAISGTAVYYNPPYTPSACFGNTDKGRMVAGASNALWNGGRACGRRYSVRCTGATNTAPHPCNGNSVIVTIVDYCRPPCNGLINLSKDAFAAIADTRAGNIRIDYTPV